MRAAAFASCLALSGSALLPFAGARDVQAVEDTTGSPRDDQEQHLAVIVPVYRGDLSRAVSSLERWPSTCSPLTEQNADLVLYYAEGEEDAPAVTAALDTIRETAGNCFAETRLVYAHLSQEEDVYPKAPSVMFFKMFVDESVHASLSEYDALAIIEWDVLVASDRSFEELHHAAFRGNEDFWVKGSNLGGTNFHSTAQVSDMWKVLGHINGNAIYNNNDPDFVEYVDYTRTCWGYTYPYDVALWLTISDFPYSWPLWQRYSSKFVTTNLISYVGNEHVDHSTVSDAVAGETLFIHGSRVEEGSLASLEASKRGRKQTLSGRRFSEDAKTPPTCNAACGSEGAPGLPVGTSTVCDDTCAGESTRFGGFLCGADDPDRFGSMCRICFVDVEEARRQEQSMSLGWSDIEGGEEASHVVMCDTMRPPEAAECSDKCGRKKDTVCDESCGTGRHGDYNCNWRDHGPKCRFCFDDLESALLADEVAKRRGGRVIMCSTLEPPRNKTPKANVAHYKTPKADVTQLASQKEDGLTPTIMELDSSARLTRKLQDNFCDEVDCPHTNSNGYRGRVCDPSCADGVPYGTNGCDARDGRHGGLCRVCYIDVERALASDDPVNRAIMCDTLLPVEAVEPVSCDEEECPYTNSVGFRGRVCDPSCADGIPYGTHGCGAREGRHGPNCRLCYNDEDRARSNDDPVDRALMCDTLLPVEPVDATCDEEECPHTNSNGFRGRVCDPSCADGIPFGTNGCNAREGRHGSNCRVCYNDVDRASNNDDPANRAIMCDTLLPVDPVEPESCDEEECPHTNSSGFRGRVCDPSCADGIPFGTNGCNAREGRHGPNCRVCYNDVDRGLLNDDPEDRAIMCDTLAPVEGPYDFRRLSASVEDRTHHNADDAQSMFDDATILPYVNDLVRGNLCAFIAGDEHEVDQVEVAVKSVLQFLPGMRVAVAADAAGFDEYQRSVGVLPGVTVNPTDDPFTASLFADVYCGVDTSLIFFMRSDSVVSRPFTSKDTHSTHGDLLVVHANSRTSHADNELAKQTTAVLGFQSPSFAFKTDLFLPVGANGHLREVLMSGQGNEELGLQGDAIEILQGLVKLRNMSVVPQLMAALAYSRNTPGVWFVDPETWVSQHLFRTASIWEIPLVKPLFTCSIDPLARASDAENMDVGLVLQSNLDYFTHGGTCDSGYIDISRGD